jgi:hypothetical protein
MARFKHTENSQGQFIAVNLKEQIALGTFEWAVSHIIDKADMPLFEKKYHNDASDLRSAGASAYPPALSYYLPQTSSTEVRYATYTQK